MKYFTPQQKIALGALSVIVVVLAFVAFATGINLKRAANAAPEVIIFELTNTPTPVPTPIPLPDELRDRLSTPSPTSTPALTPVASPEAAAAPTAAQQTAKPTVASGDAFTLTIRKQNIGVASGLEESTLEDGPGWLDTSAAPGQEGVCVVFGHRNRNHLKALEKAVYGDTITVTMPSGTQFDYRIESIEIVSSDTELRIPTLDGKHLMLVTCYPFYYTGHAPQKLVIMATLL